ncbi:MAG: VCBS repeat-containing protein [Hormoscilla sp. GUM202]|nr:VCBS repeat-containing protein [Hormoscilla sp. GUM202]
MSTLTFGTPQTNPFGLADVGLVSSPTFADLDDDGDLDLFVGNYDGKIIYFKNNGTASSPAFGTPQTNPFGLAGVGLVSTPTFADLDSDGDLDLFVGNRDGKIIYFKNKGTASSPAFGTPQTNPFGLADVGLVSSPTFADLDDDGDLDLFVGNYDGKIIYFKNNGTASSPAFGTPQTNPFGLADVGSVSSPTLADLDRDGDLDLFVGNYDGKIIYFKNNGTASSPAFGTPQTNPFGLADVGSVSSPTLADLDRDGDLDLFVGNYDGKIIYFKNKSPMDLSDSSISENSDEGAVVGTFSITDPNNGDTFTYQLVAGAGDTDNAAFTIDGDQLLFNSSPDFETKSSYSIRVKSTSAAGLSYSENFTINVKDVNEDPTDINLSNNSIDENVAANTVVGTFSTTDPDTGDSFTYQLVAGTGDTDNAAFTIDGDQLLFNSSPDFETQSSYSILVQTTDAEGESYSKNLTININDVNEDPTDINLSNNSINENVAANTVVGTFSTTDPDTGDTFTYQLVAGTGDTDNSAFTIDGDQLLFNSSPDFETQSSYSILVQSTDPGGLSYSENLTININNVNEDPTDLDLSNNSIDENVAANTVVGTFSTIDPDTGDSFTYQLVAGAGDTDNSAFTIDGDQLLFNSSPDFETQSSYSILVQTTDGGGLSYSENFTINIKDEPQLDSKDYQPMKALYEGTGGADWKKNRGWADWDFESETPPEASIVAGWHGVKVSGNRVIELILNDNELDGTIPKELGNLENLRSLHLYRNRLDGSIPTELGDLHNLKYLYVSSNQLDGSIPTELGDLHNLIGLDLAYNQLDGSIPTELGALHNLKYLHLNDNQLDGSIPSQLGNLENLEHLYLSSNQLDGSIPKELGDLDLKHLYLDHNQLSGSIPQWVLDLAYKRLENPPYIKTEITDQELLLGNNLKKVDISENFGDINDNIDKYTATGLPEGVTINSQGVISGIPTKAGTFTVAVTAIDQARGEVTDTFDIVVVRSIIGQDDRNDHLQGTADGEHLDGRAGDDKIEAFGGDDTLFGGPGNDSLHGGRGDDYLVGGEGGDYLTGGYGADTFISAPGDDGEDSGDTIVDFEFDIDSIWVEGGSSAKTQIVFQGGNTLINIGGETQVTLLDIDLTQSNLDDFIEFF